MTLSSPNCSNSVGKHVMAPFGTHLCLGAQLQFEVISDAEGITGERVG